MFPNLSFQTFSSLVQNTAAAMQGACSSLLNLTPGSVLLSILEANASVALWLQWLLTLLMKRQRLATCTGSDVDTYVQDYGCYRLPAVAAVGAVTFSRFTSTSSATVPVGATVLTGDGTQTFAVTQVITNSFWNSGLGAYVIPAATASAILPVQAQTAGAAGNVQAGTVSLLGTAIPGVDTVTNALSMTGGADAETDAALIARFPLWVAALSQATPAAIAAAIAGVQQGLTYNIAANQTVGGTYTPGTFVVTIDDGSGYPPAPLQALVYAAVDAVRPIGSTFTVQPPTVTSVAVAFTLNVAPGVIKANVVGTVSAVVTAYVNRQPVGTSLSYFNAAMAALGSLPAGQITNIESLTLNSGTPDITVTSSGVVKAGSVVIS